MYRAIPHIVNGDKNICGILVYKEEGDNSRIGLRGQDHVGTYARDGYTFIHNLLSITGEFTPQPFVDGDIVCLYNGEIYNHPFKRSDGENLIPLYKLYGAEFAQRLEGEFAIALYDFKKRIVVFAKDHFGTKPLFVKGTECGSYRSGVGGEKLPPNTIRVVNMDTEDSFDIPLYEWDLTQYKETYNDWIKAFKQAIYRRAKPGCFLGLSSGYDSGAIACELLNQGIDFKSYIFTGSENPEILEKRKKLVPEYEMFTPDYSLLPWMREFIDDEEYTIKYKSGRTFTLLTEGGTLGVATIANLAHKEGRKVCLSGQGADEIMSDYSTYPDQSELMGTFPERLKLWNNFHYGCQESYLMKEEYAGGAFNIETRYPYLDREVVQEFLWLSPELKNKNYKAPLYEYLTQNNFPFEKGIKRGFSIAL